MKVVFLVLVGCVAALSLAAQPLTRPATLGESSIDTYVDQSFDLYEEIQDQKRLMADAERLINDARTAGGGKIADPEAAVILTKLEEIGQNVVRLNESIQRVVGEYPAMQSAAKNVPKLKVAKAIKAVDTANDANKTSANDLVQLTKSVQEAVETVNSLKG